jgi:CheY-like chemotaxis protein
MKRCLIIEDELENARYIESGFKELGYETTVWECVRWPAARH